MKYFFAGHLVPALSAAESHAMHCVHLCTEHVKAEAWLCTTTAGFPQPSSVAWALLSVIRAPGSGDGMVFSRVTFHLSFDG